MNTQQSGVALQHEWRYSAEGEHTWLAGVIRSAYVECSELQVTPYELAYSRILASTIENDRIEYSAIVDGKLAGVAILVRDHDIHVGDSWAIQWNYVKPEYRTLGIAREVFRVVKALAKEDNIPFSYTKRVGDGVYKLTYVTKGVPNHG